jgi:hypothetical protein
LGQHIGYVFGASDEKDVKQRFTVDAADFELSMQLLEMNFPVAVPAVACAQKVEAELANPGRSTITLRSNFDRMITRVLSSTSRRISWPIRAVLERNPRMRRAFRRVAKLIWWSVTFQLFHRLALRRRALVAQERNLATVEKISFTAEAQANLYEFLTAGLRLIFPIIESPDVSVVIVLWNQAHLTLRCLQALLAQSGPTFEIVLGLKPH